VRVPGMRGDSPGPATASRLNATWLRMTGKDTWVPVAAKVYSCEYVDLPNTINSEIGDYHVTYSYEVDGQYYIGRFIDFGRMDEDYFRRDDTVEVRYNPQNPSKSCYPDLRTQTNFRLICFAVGGGVGLVVIILRLLFH
jgi:Protein of unknown function (DUF3592)